MADRRTLVLDLDETLVHCSTSPLAQPDFVFNVQSFQVYAKLRPGLFEFLRHVSKHFEVVIFTASHQVYASHLLDLIEQQHQQTFFSHRLYRDACLGLGELYVKDLSILNRDLAQVVIVDNSPTAFTYQVENGVPIVSWYGAQDDNHLSQLLPLLKRIATLPISHDIRPLLQQEFDLEAKIKQVAEKFQLTNVLDDALGDLLLAYDSDDDDATDNFQ
mmetsp:Transcript_9999/g.15089  ORF Transcript_9999/g.15089 Transcript_9999/m.15089 type:complete len:217 (-) Transcript_9999:28-678(-)